MEIILKSKRSELTPFLRNIIIVASLFVAVLIVLLVVYNVVSIDTETQRAEEALDLNIVKSSVKLSDDILRLSVSGKSEDLELAKVKFIISDGTNEKDISLDAEGFETQKSFQINLKELGIDYTKKLTISIKPIIKKLTGEKELKVTDKISLSPSGETIQEEIPATEEKISTTITSCDKCGGLLGKGCDKILCNSISEGCYYKGGFTKECASCSEMECGKYKTQTDCSSNKCKLGSCIWEKDECIKNPECGNGNVNSAANEECDDENLINTDACTNYCRNAVCGDGYLRTGTEQCDSGGANGIACTPSYGKTCTYCDVSCNSVTAGGENCGDNNCQSAQGETCSTCPGDCGICIKANGETCSVGTECSSGYCYVDSDNDKYAPATGTKKCQANAQLSGTDCYDSNANVFPGQANYFISNRGDGSFDYDCSENADKSPYSCSTCTSCSLSDILCVDEKYDHDNSVCSDTLKGGINYDCTSLIGNCGQTFTSQKCSFIFAYAHGGGCQFPLLSSMSGGGGYYSLCKAITWWGDAGVDSVYLESSSNTCSCR